MSSSQSIESRIREAAASNKALLKALADTDHAIPALEQQKRYIVDLQNECSSVQKRVAELDKKRKKELKEHATYRDSVMRRFAFKVSGKKEVFEQRASKEEREYFEVLQQEHQAKEMQKSVDAMLEQAMQVKESLERDVSLHKRAQLNLDSLYDAIFQGPSPGFPEEDERERISGQTLQNYHDARVRFESEDQAVKLLTDAQTTMRNAQNSMQEALSHSRMDMFGGGTLSDMMERDALSRATIHLSSASMLVMQAQRLSPAVRNLRQVNIAQGSLMSDVFFDNIWTDMAFHEKIKASNAEVARCAAELDRDALDARSRRSRLLEELHQQEKRLEADRVALQQAREAAFARVTGGTVV